MRYPVMNVGRRMGAGTPEPTSTASYGALAEAGKAFKDAIDNNLGRDAEDQAMQAFNNAFDKMLTGDDVESAPDIYHALTDQAGIPKSYLRELRPDILVNSFTNQYFGLPQNQPPGTHIGPSGNTGNNPYQAQGVKAGQKPTATEGGKGSSSGMTPEDEAAARASWPQGEGEGYPGAGGPSGFPSNTPVPVATGTSSGNAHNYEEEAAQYKQQQEEAEKAAAESAKKAEEQIKAANESAAARMKEIKEKYESGNPNAVCGPGEFWDGRQCRGSVQGAGGLVNQAMNLGPSGGAGAAGMTTVPGNLDVNPANLSLMGRRFPVVNL